MVDKTKLEFKAMTLPSWAQQMEVAEDGGVRYERKKGSNVVYALNGKDYSCLDCGTTILAVDRTHSIHDGLFPLSGSGEVAHEPIPYCPKCEKKPSSNGGFL